MLTLAALMMLTTILLNFYRLMLDNGDRIDAGQDGILATTLTSSYIDLALGRAFDSVTDAANVPYTSPDSLSGSLGPDSLHEDNLYRFNDFDDFHGFVAEHQPDGTNRRYKTSFQVHYVNPTRIEINSSKKTFYKRMDLKTWRVLPPGETDTLKISIVKGYYFFM
jgi:hypothetical protein